MAAVAFTASARTEDIYRVWTHTENLPAAELARALNEERGPPPDWIYSSGRWPDALTGEKVERAREMLGRECASCAAGTAEQGCIGDGTCVCVTGWTGDDCSVECRGGFESPCSRNGLCMQDGSCVCDQGWTGLDCSIECLGGRLSPCSFNGECLMDGSCECRNAQIATQLRCPRVRENIDVVGAVLVYASICIYESWCVLWCMLSCTCDLRQVSQVSATTATVGKTARTCAPE
jgi:hypothetical protein